MVHSSNRNTNPAIQLILKRIQEDKGCSLVFTSDSLSGHVILLYDINDASRPKTAVSIVICTYGRPDSLNDTLKSLSLQTFQDFEVLLLTERGDLSVLRDKGLRLSHADIVSFIDDDVYCEPAWLQSVVEAFKEKGVVGVSGPTIIEDEYQKNRDCLKYKTLRKIQEWVFRVPFRPGHLSPCGAPSMASNFYSNDYDGEVEYLECCNSSYKRKEAINAGGFDPTYYKTSEWCEVDLSLRIAKVGTLLFRRNCILYHRPSKAGVYGFRISTQHRWENFVYFQKKWIKPSIRRHIYWAFIWVYLKMKNLRMI